MKLDDNLTPQQMADAARKMAACIDEDAMEDAWYWLLQLALSMHDQQLRKWASASEAIDRLCKTVAKKGTL